MDDLSVIIPVYNLEKWITPMIRSLKEQELGPYTAEYIFILNNCTDNSENVIRESGLDCRILNCEIQGCGPARNVGFEASSGGYVWVMDGDDWLTTKTAIREALDMAHKHGTKILRIPFQSNGFRGIWYSMVWQYLFRRSYIDEFRFPAIQPGEDAVYMDEVFAKAGYSKRTWMRMKSTATALYFYNFPREGSTMYEFYKKNTPPRGEV